MLLAARRPPLLAEDVERLGEPARLREAEHHRARAVGHEQRTVVEVHVRVGPLGVEGHGPCSNRDRGAGCDDSLVGRALLVRWVSNVAALFVAAWLLSGVTYGDTWWSLLIAAAVFTVVNAWVKPVLAVLSIPFIVVTLGLFYFLINVLMLYVTDWVVPDFEIDTFWWGVLAAIIVSFVNMLLSPFLPDPYERPRRREAEWG
jgi:putative membrane protein